MRPAAEARTVLVNDRPHALAGDGTLLALMGELGLTQRRGVAAAVNGAVVPRTGWAARPLAEGDRVILIRATQGG
jgi:sulfur carrier protein